MSSHVEQIKSRIGIADVVQSYMKLQKAGANFRACCPFHNEKTPSFFVSPARESWHCFGCNRGGDIFSFVMEIEGLEFSQALKILADRTGVEIKPESRELVSERTRVSQALEEAKIFYEGELKNNQGVIEYLKERGLTGETAKAFGVGFAPDGWRNLRDFLSLKSFTDQEMEKAGIVIKPASDNDGPQKGLPASRQGHYDRFRSRIMFPLNNSSGHIVGFSGRIFGNEDDKMGKYINTPQTILYDKSRTLYGFDKAKMEIRKKDACILVEGQMDVIMSHQAGFTNTVAVSGTALTDEHLKIIKRLTNNLIMAFDKDEAGFNASKRGIDMALAEGFEVNVAVVPSGKDPADTIKENPEEWEKAVANATHIIEFYLDALSKLPPRESRKEIEETILPRVAVLRSEIEKAHWVKKIAGKLALSEDPIWEQMKKIKFSGSGIKNATETKSAPTPVVQKTRLQLLENRILGLLLWQKNTDDIELKSEIEKALKGHNWDLEKENDRLVFEAELFYNESNNLSKELASLLLEFEKEKIRLRLEELSEEIRRAEASQDDEGLKRSLDEVNQLTKKINELK